MPAKLTLNQATGLFRHPYLLFFHILNKCPLSQSLSFHILTNARGMYPSALSWCNKMNHLVAVLPLNGGFSGVRSSTGHGSQVTFPPVAAFLPGCYDLVFHDPR